MGDRRAETFAARIARAARPAHRRRTRRPLIAILAATAVVAAGLLAVPSATTPAAAAGIPLVTESFTGTSVADPSWQPLDSACLTRATAAPPTGSSTVGVCSSRTNSPASTTNPGFLQLTDNVTNKKGGIVYNKAIPANGGVDVLFDQYQYSGLLGLAGADGIGFFLSDGSRSLTTAGAPGGSLGYAPSSTADGVNGGYLGIGLDAYGNFSSTGADGTGCTAAPGSDDNRIVARGPGQARAGYCYLAGATPATAVRAPSILGTGQTNPVATSGRTVRVTVSSAALPVVTVYYGASAGMAATALTQVMQFTMPSTSTRPTTYKLGFTASTGGSTDTHLVRNVSVSTIDTLGALNLVKQLDRTTTQPASYKEGDTIPYQFVLTNTSATTLTSLVVTDPKIAAISCPVTTLASLATTTCTGSHVLTAAEAVAGTTFVNTASATALASGVTVTSNTSTVTVPVTTPAPTLSLVKTATLVDGNANAQADLGEKINYTFRATNTGNVTLQNVAVTDPRVTGITPASATIAPGAFADFTSAQYTVTQADINTGTTVSNTASVTGRTLANAAAPTATSTANVPVRFAPSIGLTKDGALAGASAAGGTVNYSFTITNTGNVPLTSVAITDPMFPATGAITYSWPGTAGSLAIGQSATATAIYTLTQANVDAGTLSNTATARGTSPTSTVVQSTATKVLSLPRTPNMTHTKAASPTFVLTAGTVVTYTFTIANTGNVTLTSVGVTDPMITGTITYGTWTSGTAGRLAPGQSITATASYTTTAANITAGSFTNTATATGTPPSGAGAAISRQASATVTARPNPVADTVTVVQGQAVTFNVLANDGGAAAGTTTFSRAQLSATPTLIGGATGPAPSTPIQGSVTCVDSGVAKGDCTYRSLDYFAGTDTFDYALQNSYGVWNVRVTITVQSTNRAPVARADRLVATTGGGAVTVQPLANDTDEDAVDTLAIASTTPPAGMSGTFSCASGTCTYTPANDGWTGTISVAYTITDRASAPATGLGASSTITIWVDPAPLQARGFHSTDAATASVGLGTWTTTTAVTAPAGTCVANRPSTTIGWTAQAGTTSWVIERRLAGATPGDWVGVARVAAGTTSYTDDRVGEGRSYQYQVRPDVYRWPGVFSAASAASSQPVALTAKGC